MTFEEIKQNIANWNNIINDSSKIIPYFDGETYFDFSSLPAVSTSGLGLHFYPAITLDSFFLYVIDIANDNEQKYESDPTMFHQYIHQFDLLEAPKINNDMVRIDDRISKEEALKRMLAWVEHHESWITAKAPVAGIFEAFSYESNIAQDIDKGNFGLFINNGPFTYNADIVLQGVNQAYYNTVRPVPPYGQGGKEAFFLLTASTNPELSESLALKSEG